MYLYSALLHTAIETLQLGSTHGSVMCCGMQQLSWLHVLEDICRRLSHSIAAEVSKFGGVVGDGIQQLRWAYKLRLDPIG